MRDYTSGVIDKKITPTLDNPNKLRYTAHTLLKQEHATMQYFEHTATLIVLYTRPKRMGSNLQAEIKALGRYLSKSLEANKGAEYTFTNSVARGICAHALVGAGEENVTSAVATPRREQVAYSVRVVSSRDELPAAMRRLAETIGAMPAVTGLTVTVKPDGAAIGAELIEVAKAIHAQTGTLSPELRAALETTRDSLRARLRMVQRYRDAVRETTSTPLADIERRIAEAPEQVRAFVDLLGI